jgi:hypothetical protein
MRVSPHGLAARGTGHPFGMRVYALAALLVLALASTAGAAQRPTLRFVGLEPLVLRASAFRPNELVRVTVSVDGSQGAKQVRASRAGGFVVRFSSFSAGDRCSSDVWASARGRLGSGAIAKPRPQLQCPPRLAPAG